MKPKLEEVEKELERLRSVFNEGVYALAEKIHAEMVVPACEKYNLYFLSGNGSWCFYENDPKWKGQGLYSDQISDPDDAIAHRKRRLIPLLEILHTAVDDDCDLGIYINDAGRKNASPHQE